MSVPMFSEPDAKALTLNLLRGAFKSRHQKVVLGLVFRIEALRRIEPGGMHNRDGKQVSQERIQWRRRRLERTMQRERRLLAMELLEATP